MNALVLASLLTAASPVRFAIVVGVNQPVSPDVAPLAFADDDAILTDRLMRSAGVDSTLLVSLDDESRSLFSAAQIANAATPEAVNAAFERAFAGIAKAKAEGAETELYFFYSGHGDVEHGEGFIALDSGRLSRSQLYREILGRSQADTNHVIIDACRSYFFVFPKGPGGHRASYDIDLSDDPSQFANTGFVLSTSSDRDSHEWARLRAGVFSHEVRSALYGGADVDRDGVISYAELGAFIETANGAIPNPRFRPDAIVRPPRIERDSRRVAMLAWSAPEERRVDMPAEASLGHVYLEDALGIRLADAHPAEGKTLSLYVPTARPLFLRGVKVRREYAIERDAPVVLAMNEAQDASIGEKGAIHLAFRSLFDTPMTTAAVDAFAARQQVESVVMTNARLEVDPLDQVRTIAPWVAGSAALAGGVLTTTAIVLRSGADSKTQADQVTANQTIDGLNAGAVTLYSTAAVAALTWVVLELID